MLDGSGIDTAIWFSRGFHCHILRSSDRIAIDAAMGETDTIYTKLEFYSTHARTLTLSSEQARRKLLRGGAATKMASEVGPQKSN